MLHELELWIMFLIGDVTAGVKHAKVSLKDFGHNMLGGLSSPSVAFQSRDLTSVHIYSTELTDCLTCEPPDRWPAERDNRPHPQITQMET